LIAAIIASIAITAGFKVFIDTNKNHIIQTSLADMQQNGRAAMDKLVDELRQAGYRVPVGVKCMKASNTNPDTVSVSFLEEPLCTATVSVSMAQPTSDITVASSPLVFPVGSWAYIYDVVTQTGEYFQVSGVDNATKKIQHTSSTFSKAYPQKAQVFIMDYVKFYVDKSDTTHPRFMRQANGAAAQVYCDNVSDMQLKYTLSTGLVYDTIPLDRLVREIKVTLVSRTEKKDLFKGAIRYDTLNSRVMIRNLAM
jgi:Tfp pilus assembly protein PilW